MEYGSLTAWFTDMSMNTSTTYSNIQRTETMDWHNKGWHVSAINQCFT